MNFDVGSEQSWKTQPIRGWWKTTGAAKGRPRQYGRNCSNLHVIEADKCVAQPVVTTTESVNTSEPVNNPVPDSSCQEKTEESENIPKDNDDLDEVSDSSLMDDEKSSEKWENISDGSFGEMYEVDTIDVSSSSSTTSKAPEFSVGYRSCARKYLKSYKAVNFFKPKIYLFSKNRCIVNCLNINERQREESESEEMICVEVDDPESAHDVIDQDSGSVNSDTAHDDVSKEDDEGTANEDTDEKDVEKDTEDGVTVEDEVTVCQDDVTSDTPVANSSAAVENNEEIKFCQGNVEIQDEIDKAEDPLLGLEYIVEVWDDAKCAVLNYSCWLCDKISLEKAIVLDHVKSVVHRVAYLITHCPSQSAKFTQSDTLSEDLMMQLELLCKELSTRYQKFLPFVTTQSYLDNHGYKLMEFMSATAHYESSDGHSVKAKGDSNSSHSDPQKSEVCKSTSTSAENTEPSVTVPIVDHPSPECSAVSKNVSEKEKQSAKGLETVSSTNKPVTSEGPSNLSVICSSERSLLKYRRMRSNKPNIPVRSKTLSEVPTGNSGCSVSLKNKTLSEVPTNTSSSNISILPSGGESTDVVVVKVIGGDKDMATKIKGKKHVHRKPHRAFCRKNHSGKVTQNIILHSPVSEKPKVSQAESEGVTKNLGSKENDISRSRRQRYYRSVKQSVYTWVRPVGNDSKSKNTSNAITIDKSEGRLAHEDATQSGKKDVSSASEKTEAKQSEDAVDVALPSRTKRHSKMLSSKGLDKKWVGAAGIKAGSSLSVQNDSKLSGRYVEESRSSNSRKESRVSKQFKIRNHSPAEQQSPGPFRQKRQVREREMKKKSQSPFNTQSSHSVASMRKTNLHSRSPLKGVKRHLHSPLRKERQHSVSPVRRMKQYIQRSKNESESNDVRRPLKSIRTRTSPVSRVSPVGRHVRSIRRSRSVSRHRSKVYSLNERMSASPPRIYKAYSRSPIRSLRRDSWSRSRSPRRLSRSVSRSPRRLSRGRTRSLRRRSRSTSSPLRRHHDSRSRSPRRRARNNSPYTARQRSRSPRHRKRSRSPLQSSKLHRRSRSRSIHRRRSSRSLSSEIDSLVGKRSAKSFTREGIERGKLFHPFENISDNNQRSSEQRITHRKEKEFENDIVSRSEFMSMLNASYPFQPSQSVQYAFPNPPVPPVYSTVPQNILPINCGASVNQGGVTMGNMQFSSPVTSVQTPDAWLPSMSQPYTKAEFKSSGNVQPNAAPFSHAKKPSFENERLFQDMRSAVNKLFGTSVSGEKFSHDLPQSRPSDSNSAIQTGERYQTKNMSGAQTLIPGINDYGSSHGMGSQADTMNIDAEALLERTLNHIKSNLSSPFLDRDEILRSAVLELLPKELLRQLTEVSKYSSAESSQAQNIKGQFGQNVSEPANVQPPPPPMDAKVQFKEGSKISNPVNIFPIVNRSMHSTSVDRHASHNTSHADNGESFKGNYESSDSSQKLSLAQRLASVLVKLGMTDVPGSLLSEMLHTIGAFNPSMPLQDISESQIVTILHKCGYLRTK